VATWSVDKSGRFPQRLFLRAAEIDHDCERLVRGFLHARYGTVTYPLTTEDLTVFVEQHCTRLDQYADLSAEGDDVEGMTCFAKDGPPDIFISQELSTQPHRENRLRTTLAHEFGHAFYHRAVFDDLFRAPRGLFEAARTKPRTVCKRATMLQASEIDWLEWQAGYVSGAILMPATPLRRMAADLLRDAGVHAAAVVGSPAAERIERATVDRFQVSREAAQVRLRKLGLVSDSAGQPTLFG
jgi:Zn-dependent peptidase ImmA (M78 family)